MGGKKVIWRGLVFLLKEMWSLGKTPYIYPWNQVWRVTDLGFDLTSHFHKDKSIVSSKHEYVAFNDQSERRNKCGQFSNVEGIWVYWQSKDPGSKCTYNPLCLISPGKVSHTESLWLTNVWPWSENVSWPNVTCKTSNYIWALDCLRHQVNFQTWQK